MTFDPNIKTLGFKDMHEDQVEAFVSLVQAVLHLADSMGDEEIFEQAKDIAEDAVVLFGGHGIEVEYSVDH